jgi:protein SCO1
MMETTNMLAPILRRFGMVPSSAGLPNVILRTHRNAAVRFYQDLLRDRIVGISFMYTRCEGRCPLTIASLRALQEALGPRAGRDVFLYSITLDPDFDTPRVLRDYAAVVGAGPGWSFVTGSARDIELIRRRLGFFDPDPRIDADKSQHAGLILFGNDRTDQWVACPALLRTERIMKVLTRIGA